MNTFYSSQAIDYPLDTSANNFTQLNRRQQPVMGIKANIWDIYLSEGSNGFRA